MGKKWVIYAGIFLVIILGFYFIPSMFTGLTITSIEDGNEESSKCVEAGRVVSDPLDPMVGIGRVCCEGLVKIESLENIGKECKPLGGAAKICSDCGNGNCESWESVCNCPKDCQ